MMYGPFEQRGIDWDDAYDRWRPQVHDEMTERRTNFDFTIVRW